MDIVLSPLHSIPRIQTDSATAPSHIDQSSLGVLLRGLRRAVEAWWALLGIGRWCQTERFSVSVVKCTT